MEHNTGACASNVVQPPNPASSPSLPTGAPCADHAPHAGFPPVCDGEPSESISVFADGSPTLQSEDPLTSTWNRMQRITRMVLQGGTNTEIAEQLGVSASVVSAVRNSPAGRDRLLQLQRQADEQAVVVASRIRELVPEAIGAYESVLRGAEVKDADRLRAADRICDMAGFTAKKSGDHAAVNIHITSGELASAKDRALQVARDAGLLVDIPSVQVLQREEVYA